MFAKQINPFYANVLFLYLLKTPENQNFSDVFRGYRNMTLDVKRINIKDFKIRFYKNGSKIAFWKNFSFEKEHPWGVILIKLNSIDIQLYGNKVM